jgi:hypothetical protein
MKEYALNKELQLEIGNIKRRTATIEERRQVEIEESLEILSRWLDDLIRIPVVGWRVGLDAIIGLVPGFGDTATTLASFYILIAGVRYGVPKITLLRMALNIAIDYLVGALPFIGDVFDFVWKANKKNLELIKQRATVSPEERRRGKFSDWIFVLFIMLALVGILFGSITISVLVWSFAFALFYKLL